MKQYNTCPHMPLPEVTKSEINTEKEILKFNLEAIKNVIQKEFLIINKFILDFCNNYSINIKYFDNVFYIGVSNSVVKGYAVYKTYTIIDKEFDIVMDELEVKI